MRRDSPRCGTRAAPQAILRSSPTTRIISPPNWDWYRLNLTSYWHLYSSTRAWAVDGSSSPFEHFFSPYLSPQGSEGYFALVELWRLNGQRTPTPISNFQPGCVSSCPSASRCRTTRHLIRLVASPHVCKRHLPTDTKCATGIIQWDSHHRLDVF